MKTWMKRMSLGVILMASLAFMVGCGNEEKVGYVDLGRVQMESAKYQELQQKVEARRADILKRIQEVEQSGDQAKVQQTLQSTQQEIQTFMTAMSREFESSVNAAVADVARQKSLTIVTDKTTTLTGGEDITDAVLDKLGRKSATKAEEAPKAANPKTEEAK